MRGAAHTCCLIVSTANKTTAFPKSLCFIMLLPNCFGPGEKPSLTGQTGRPKNSLLGKAKQSKSGSNFPRPAGLWRRQPEERIAIFVQRDEERACCCGEGK